MLIKRQINIWEAHPVRLSPGNRNRHIPINGIRSRRCTCFSLRSNNTYLLSLPMQPVSIILRSNGNSIHYRRETVIKQSNHPFLHYSNSVYSMLQKYNTISVIGQIFQKILFLPFPIHAHGFPSPSLQEFLFPARSFQSHIRFQPLFSFNKSRISVSNWISAGGAGGAGFWVSFFFDKTLMPFTKKNTASAIIRKSNVT